MAPGARAGWADAGWRTRRAGVDCMVCMAIGREHIPFNPTLGCSVRECEFPWALPSVTLVKRALRRWVICIQMKRRNAPSHATSFAGICQTCRNSARFRRFQLRAPLVPVKVWPEYRLSAISRQRSCNSDAIAIHSVAIQMQLQFRSCNCNSDPRAVKKKELLCVGHVSGPTV